ncbi:MAG: hypothetical protein ACR2MY_09665 [Candidatus Dormibacteria bacterium]
MVIANLLASGRESWVDRLTGRQAPDAPLIVGVSAITVNGAAAII